MKINSKLEYIQQNHQLLIDFTCATAKDELEKHPEMQTIAMIELENNFPSEFSREVLKCLPADVAKIILNQHSIEFMNRTVYLPRQSMVIYVADKLKLQHTDEIDPTDKFSLIHHLSKKIILSSKRPNINETQKVFSRFLNVVQIFEENHKVIARSFDMIRNLTTFETSESPQRENLSQILFPDKARNLNGQTLYASFIRAPDAYFVKRLNKINSKWMPFFDIIAHKLNANFNFTQMPTNRTSWLAFAANRKQRLFNLINSGKLDFYMNLEIFRSDLQSYNNREWCFIAPVPDPIPITDQILFLPMDKSCWMWLGITIAVSTLIWRISEGHWNFAFGAFSYFMGQAQLSVRIRTDRLTMKILLQLLIFGIFILSFSYQCLVTSFMLNPMQRQLLKSIDELLDSDLKFVSYNYYPGDNPKYQKAKRDGRIVQNLGNTKTWGKSVGKHKIAVPQPCIHMKRGLERWGNGKSYRGVYMISEVAFSALADLYVRPYHPYIEKFQELMDRSFEAGLHQAWESLYLSIFSYEEEDQERSEEEKELLDFGLIAPFFLILVFGFGPAFFALLCEIFWKDFVSNLTKEYLLRKLNEISWKKTSKNVKARRVQVQPVSGST